MKFLVSSAVASVAVVVAIFCVSVTDAADTIAEKGKYTIISCQLLPCVVISAVSLFH